MQNFCELARQMPVPDEFRLQRITFKAARNAFETLEGRIAHAAYVNYNPVKHGLVTRSIGPIRRSTGM